MRPALLCIFTPNELIRRYFLRWQAEKLPATLRHREKHSPGFSYNLQVLRVLASGYEKRRIGSSVQNFSKTPGKPVLTLAGKS
jgi:hypothetical protein